MEGSVSRQSIWTDVVKRGEMRRQVRGLGVLGPNGAAEIKIAETQTKDLRLGQAAAVDFRGPIASGRLAAIQPGVVNGTVTVIIQLDAPPPSAAQEGQQVDAVINIEVLPDVVYVARPVSGQPNSNGTLFKIEPDGQHAVRVPVRFGRSSVNQIEVVSGLVPGDKVIVSDLSPFTRLDRLQLR
jgi:HlyD family secretion protein